MESAKRVIGQLEKPDHYWRSISQTKLTEPELAEVTVALKALKKKDPKDIAVLEMLRLGVSWRDAMKVMFDLECAWGWGSKQLKKKFKTNAARPEVVTALQAAVLVSPKPDDHMLAILAVDGSEASVDALLPIFASGKNDLLLERLKVHAAKTPALTAMFEQVRGRIATRAAGNPATNFINRVLDADLKSVDIDFHFQSRTLRGSSAKPINAQLRLTSREGKPWWSLWMHEFAQVIECKANKPILVPFTFTSIEGVPAWLEAYRKQRGVKWVRPDLTGTLRGKKREAFARWVLG